MASGCGLLLQVTICCMLDNNLDEMDKKLSPLCKMNLVSSLPLEVQCLTHSCVFPMTDVLLALLVGV